AFADICRVPLPLGRLDRDARALMEQVDQSIESQPELREAVERLAQEEAEPPPLEPDENLELAPDEPESASELAEPPPELPSSAAVLRDLEDFLRDLRQQNGGPPPDNSVRGPLGWRSGACAGGRVFRCFAAALRGEAGVSLHPP